MCTPPFPCAECNRTPVQTTGRVIYPHRPDLWHKFFYRCSCGAYVGCHPDTEDPLGRPAGPELRKARGQVHKVLDRIWMSAPKDYAPGGKLSPQQIRSMARKRTYRYLGARMGLSEDDCHTAMFDLDQCRNAYRLLLSVTYADVRHWWKTEGQGRRKAA